MPGSFPVTIAFLDKCNNTRTQLNRMRLAHGRPPSMGPVNHKSATWKIMKQENRNTLWAHPSPFRKLATVVPKT